jgi:hypothetical protein
MNTDPAPPHASRYDGDVTSDIPPATLATKSLRGAFRRCSTALDDLTDEECTRVIRALAALFGVECP